MRKLEFNAELASVAADLPALPADWHFEGRRIVYDGPKADEWARFLCALRDIGVPKSPL